MPLFDTASTATLLQQKRMRYRTEVINQILKFGHFCARSWTHYQRERGQRHPLMPASGATGTINYSRGGQEMHASMISWLALHELRKKGNKTKSPAYSASASAAVNIVAVDKLVVKQPGHRLLQASSHAPGIRHACTS